MEINYKDLRSLLLDDISAAIEYCQVVICSMNNFESFRDFYNFHKKHSHISTCQKEWECQMSIHCDNCCLIDNSCLCLQCFLQGNHEGHEYHVLSKSSGNCDCGDLSQWKRSGCCSTHHGLDEDSHPENYLDEDFRNFLTDVIFRACFSTIKHLVPNDTDNLSIILKFLQSFLSFGDGFRRLIAISLTEKINFEKFMNTIFNANLKFNQELQHFFGFLVNDQVFKKNFSAMNYKLMINKIIPDFYKFNDIQPNIIPWNNMWYHGYSQNEMKYQIEYNNWDYINFLIQELTYMKDLFLYVGKYQIPNKIPYVFIEEYEFSQIMQIQSIEKIQNFFDLFITKVISSGTTKGIENNINDTTIVTSFNENLFLNHFILVNKFNLNFYDILNSFKLTRNLKIDKFIEELDKSFDISQIFLIGKNAIGDGSIENENDKFIARFLKQKEEKLYQIEINEDNYKSFPNGSSFFVSHLMLLSLMHLMRNNNFCRVKIARFLSETKYQSLRIRLAIATLKSVVAHICSNQLLVSKNNQAISQLSLFNENKNAANYGIPLYIPLLQLTFGLQCINNKIEDEFAIKEFFAFETAREIGLFDDNLLDSENEKMCFSFLYLIILLVIERKLFHFDCHQFIKEQLSFELKHGVSHLNDLDNMYDSYVVIDTKFDLSKTILEIATAKQSQKESKFLEVSGDQDVSLSLKEGIEVNPISAIISINRENDYMNNEITKNPNKLIKIQSFDPEETYFFNSDEEEEKDLKIRLKDLLFTPTVLAIVYKSLRNESELQKVGLNEHLAMNILVLISKFINESESQECEIAFNETTTINYDSTLVDLISQLKQVVFNFKVDEIGDATLQNTLTKKAFNTFLKMKIGSNKELPKSFIDILLEKGEIGKFVLSQISVECESIKKDKVEDSKISKKIRAKKLKEDIMKNFKNAASSFDSNDDDDDDDNSPLNVDKDSCSICSILRKNDILCYPLYFYRTKFPFIIDKPPLVKLEAQLAVRETEVHEDDDCDEINSLLSNLDDDDDDENEEFPSFDEMFVKMINERPELDITNDLSNEEKAIRRSQIDELRDNLISNYEQMKQDFYDNKNKRKGKRKLLLNIKRQLESESIDPDCFVTKRITAGNNFVIQFGICQHLVHHDCVKQKEFTCSIDRTIKNGLLPNIDDLTSDSIFTDKNDLNCEVNYEILSDELKESLKKFIETYSQFIKSQDDKIIDVFVELVKSISGLISTFEVRLRSLPNCLDSKKSKYLSRNLFLTTWYAYRMKGKPTMNTGFEDDISEDVNSKLTIFQRFIKKLVECDDIEGLNEQKKDQAFHEITASFITLFDCKTLRSEKELFLFLKRVHLADYFLLRKMKNNENDNSNEQTKIIDWDEALSSQNLSLVYEVMFHKLDKFEFKPFVFSKMPKEFIRFGTNPYNFPIDQTKQITLFNILNYNKMILKYSDFDENNSSLDCSDYLNELSVINGNMNGTLKNMFSKKNYPSILLFVTGCTSSILIVDQNKYKTMKPFYLDKFGFTDIGFAREQALFLNEERYERVMDGILSGDFTTGIVSFQNDII